jgi:hypothetical protein
LLHNYYRVDFENNLARASLIWPPAESLLYWNHSICATPIIRDYWARFGLVMVIPGGVAGGEFS